MSINSAFIEGNSGDGATYLNPFILLEDLEALVPHFEAQGVSLEFVELFRKAGGQPSRFHAGIHQRRDVMIRKRARRFREDLSLGWENRQEGAVDGLPWGLSSRPTKGHLWLIAWGFTPDPVALNNWLDSRDHEEGRDRVRSRFAAFRA